MTGNKTFTIIKPLAVQEGHIGHILSMTNDAGFRITALRFIHMRIEDAKAFYEVHKERPFYNSLVVAILEKDNAVEDYRKLIGSTNPADATTGTIRKLYGTSIEANAVHGSDSDDNADIESNFFFSKQDRH
jgi:nucleoside-diphosphate kinase